MRRRIAASRKHPVDDDAGLDERVAFIAQPLQRGQRQVAAGGFAADSQARCVQAQRRRLVAQPAQGAQHLLQRDGVAGFGRQGVRQTCRDNAGFGRDLALPAVQGVQVAMRETTPMQMQVQRQRPLRRALRVIQAQRGGHGKMIQPVLDHAVHGRRGLAQPLLEGAALFAGFGNGRGQHVRRANSVLLGQRLRGQHIGSQGREGRGGVAHEDSNAGNPVV
ncbi:hypothetical protein D3C85_1251030 [compost metagenome]